jgi:hypothetical protein
MRSYEARDIMDNIRPVLRVLYGNHKFKLVGFSMLDSGGYPITKWSGWFHVKDLRENKVYNVNLEKNKVVCVEERK